jgi:hypothetical protein
LAFYEPGTWLEVRPDGDARADTTAAWAISAATEDQLVEGIKRVWPCCGTLARSPTFQVKSSLSKRV